MAKIKKSLNRPTFFPRAIKRFKEKTKVKLKQAIIDKIQGGESPVSKETGGTKGKGDWKKSNQYTKEYARQKGVSRSAVDMTVTGKMLRSLKFRLTKNGLVIWFSSSIAKYHNSMGAGKSRVIRRLLPTKKGERFTPDLMRLLRKILKSEINSARDRRKG